MSFRFPDSNSFWRGLLLAGVLLLTVPHGMAASDATYDPFEKVNRGIFAFNEFADRWLLKPVAKGYRWLTPDAVDNAITRVFNNIFEVGNTVNAGLQGDFRQSGISLGRLLINSTIGIGGIFDVASGWGLPYRREDVGQTLGRWGVGEGPYIVLPFFGPANLRDGFSRIPDIYLSPLTYIDDVSTRNTLRALDIVDDRADLLDVEQLVIGDRYIFLRDVYLQRRRGDIANGVLADMNQGDSVGGFDDDFDSDF